MCTGGSTIFSRMKLFFLDLEVDGVDGESDIIVVGLFDGITTKTMIRGINLDFNNLREELKNTK